MSRKSFFQRRSKRKPRKPRRPKRVMPMVVRVRSVRRVRRRRTREVWCRRVSRIAIYEWRRETSAAIERLTKKV